MHQIVPPTLHTPVAVMYTLPYSFLHLFKILGSILVSLSLAYSCHILDDLNLSVDDSFQ